MRRKVLALLTISGLAFAGLVATPPNAQASLSQCSLTGRICVWTDAEFGPDSSYQAYATQVRQFPPIRTNSISSIWNRYSQGWIFYDGPDFTNPIFCLTPGTRVRNLADYPYPGAHPNFNDRINSARRTGFADCPSSIFSI